jgi:hypothetical protein
MITYLEIHSLSHSRLSLRDTGESTVLLPEIPRMSCFTFVDHISEKEIRTFLDREDAAIWYSIITLIHESLHDTLYYFVSRQAGTTHYSSVSEMENELAREWKWCS